MVTYSIKDLEKLSGIKAHTIRIWEQRYGLIDPKRTQTNIRFYTDEDLKYILNISFLNKNGLRISQIARMGREDVAKKVATISQDNLENTNQIQTLTMAMMELNTIKVEQILRNHIQQDNLENTILTLIVPFLEKIGALWLTGSVSTVHEQLVHNIIRQKVLAATETTLLALPKFKPIKCLLYLMPNEETETILILIQFLLLQRGVEVMYLGSRISLNDLDLAYQLQKPDFIFTNIAGAHPKLSLPEYLQKLSAICTDATVLLTGHQALSEEVKVSPNLRLLADFIDIIEFFDDIVAQTN